jgi:hypothetical protein
MSGRLDVGATLREVFETYRNHAGLLLPVAFWLYLIVAVVDGLVNGDISLFPVEIVVSTIVATLYQGMVVGLVRDVQDGRRDSSFRELMGTALPVLAPLIGAGILSGLGVGVGFALFVVPGLYLLTIWSVIAPTIVVERRAVFDAFGRSRQLVKGEGWPVFWVIVIAFLIAILASLLFGYIAVSLANGPIVRIVFSAIASTLTAPITALAAAVLYFRLVEIKGATTAPPAVPPPGAPSPADEDAPPPPAP